MKSYLMRLSTITLLATAMTSGCEVSDSVASADEPAAASAAQTVAKKPQKGPYMYTPSDYVGAWQVDAFCEYTPCKGHEHLNVNDIVRFYLVGSDLHATMIHPLTDDIFEANYRGQEVGGKYVFKFGKSREHPNGLEPHWMICWLEDNTFNPRKSPRMRFQICQGQPYKDGDYATEPKCPGNTKVHDGAGHSDD